VSDVVELPTEVHALARVHDTPSSCALGPAVGVDWICQMWPLTAVGPKNPASPTAMHALADAQDTSRSVPLTTPSGATGCWSVHPEAFAACAVGRANAATTTLPTANSLANIARADDT
jgi:hypothetical protein